LDLSGQTAHALACAQRELAAAPPHARAIVCGHSVGAHIALASLRVLPPTTRAVLWAPTIAHIGRSANAVSLHCLMFRGRTALGAAALLLSALPPCARRRAVSAYLPRGAPPLTVDAADSILARRVAVSALYMAADEMLKIVETDASLARERAVFAIFAKDDPWNGRGADARAAAKLLPGAVIVEAGWLEHGFVLHEAQTERVAASTAQWILSGETSAQPTASARKSRSRPRTRA
jgi:alpha-beta hydrolase superfamily lysophospholipase